MKLRTVVVLAVLAVVVVFGAYLAINFILPSIVTQVAVTGVPTASGDRLESLKQTATARASMPTPTNSAMNIAPSGSIVFASYSENPNRRSLIQGSEPLYVSCTTARGATATPQGEMAPTPEATLEPTAEPTAAAAGPENFVFLSIVPEESEACFQVGEILRGQFVLAVGVSRSISGEVAVDLNNASNSQPGDEINVNLAELQTDQPNRDRWVISDRGFNFNAFPIARLTNIQVSGLPARPVVEGEELSFQIIGDMTIKETTKQLTFTATGKWQNETLVVTAYTDTKLTEIGLFPPNLGFVAVNDDFRIILNLVMRAG